MASPANRTNISAAAAVGGGLASGDALVASALLDPKMLAEGRFNEGADNDDETCDARARRIRDLFTLIRTVTGYIQGAVRYLNLFNSYEEQRALVERILQGDSVLMPDRESATYRTFFFEIDRRDTLRETPLSEENYVLEVSVLASKFAYENEKAAADLVSTRLEGTDYRFFNCRNASLDEKTTQAIGFVRYEGQLRRATVYVAFRGSELTSPGDWETNFDCGHLTMGRDFGKVHKGFMKALGLLSDTGDFDRDFPRELPSWERWDPLPAYYAIRTWLRDVVSKKLGKETGVQLRVVGHSQGGALAILFATMLLYHGASNVMPTTSFQLEVITMGQPRVGDADFAERMTSTFLEPTAGVYPRLVYKRMVYRDDPVPRIPFDDDPMRKTRYSRYRHFGTCLYYEGWKNKSRRPGDEALPNENFELMYVPEGLRQAAEDVRDAVRDARMLQEPVLTQAARFLFPYPVQFHTISNYLNAAKHGTGPRSKRRGPRALLRALLHYSRRASSPPCCWDRKRLQASCSKF